ncbi:MAG: hypothetical protein R3B12_01705 [Candidatus Saccharimonadales bacterium]
MAIIIATISQTGVLGSGGNCGDIGFGTCPGVGGTKMFGAVGI